MPVSVLSTISRSHGSRRSHHRASRNSTAEALGNLGWVPKPPYRKSNRRAIFSALSASSSGARAPPLASLSDVCTCVFSSRAVLATLSRSAAKISRTRFSTARKPGRPYLPSGGK